MTPFLVSVIVTNANELRAVTAVQFCRYNDRKLARREAREKFRARYGPRLYLLRIRRISEAEKLLLRETLRKKNGGKIMVASISGRNPAKKSPAAGRDLDTFPIIFPANAEHELNREKRRFIAAHPGWRCTTFGGTALPDDVASTVHGWLLF